MLFFFTKSCREKRSEKSTVKNQVPAIFVVENSISNVAYNRPVVATATYFVAENILDVFPVFSDLRAKKSKKISRYPYCILRKTVWKSTYIF